jgi:hypothetical protein
MDYKKYSLEQLENWMYDAMSCGDATPQEIYDVIIEVVKDNYYTYKKQASEAYELLSLLNGNGGWTLEEVLKEKEYYEPSMPPWGHSDLEYMIHNKEPLSCDKDDPSPECKGAWNNFWEDSMPPWGHSGLEYLANPTLTEDRISNFPGEQYTEEELNVMCEKAASDEEKEKCREYNLREAEYYNKRAKLDAEVEEIKAAGGYDWTPSVEGKKSKYYYEYDRNDPNRENPFKDRVVKWQLPIEVDGLTGDCFVEFPNDLLEAANLKEGDTVEWVDNGDGSYLLKKV